MDGIAKSRFVKEKKSGFKSIRIRVNVAFPVHTNPDIFETAYFFSTNRPSIRPYETSAGICSPSPKSHLFETAHENGLFGPVVN